MRWHLWMMMAIVLAYGCMQEEVIEIQEHHPDEDYVFIQPEQVPPKYKHGTLEELQQLIYQQLKYPAEQCVEGITVLAFVIDKSGKVVSAEVKRSISKAIDEQLIRLIHQYEFEPGYVGGHLMKCQVNMPFKIGLQENRILKPITLLK